jgi:hypothetical protein
VEVVKKTENTSHPKGRKTNRSLPTENSKAI